MMISDKRADAMANGNSNYSLPAFFELSEFYCRNEQCNRVELSRGIPNGWYIVKRSQGPNEKLKTAAVVCSVLCLAMDAMDYLYEKSR